MTLEEAIEHVEKIYKENRSGWLYALKRGETKYAERCKKSMDTLEQIVKWLSELQERRKQPEIIWCKDCKYAEIADPEDNQDGYTCQFHRGSIWFSGSYCSWAERRTDERRNNG